MFILKPKGPLGSGTKWYQVYRTQQNKVGKETGGTGGGTYRPQAVLVAPVRIREQSRAELERPEADGCLGRGEVDHGGQPAVEPEHAPAGNRALRHGPIGDRGVLWENRNQVVFKIIHDK